MLLKKGGAARIEDDAGPGTPATWDGRHRWILPGRSDVSNAAIIFRGNGPED
jgi:hypothetical protein